MFKGHRVVACVPSGRYRYMRVLLPYLFRARDAGILDEVRLWVNTDVADDIAYFERMELTQTRVTLATSRTGPNKVAYDESRGHYQFNDSIFRFYAGCLDPDTVYVKLDDDICFIDDGFFPRICEETLAREATNYACVGNVFNVPHVTSLLQAQGVLDDSLGRSSGDPRCPIACTNGPFAVHIHKQFLRLQGAGQLGMLRFASHELAGRQRIGVMAWTGRNFMRFGGKVGEQDEVDLTTKIPLALNMPLWMVGDAVASHFAFSHQRAELEDMTNMLQRYLALSIRLNGDVAA